ncbi:MAG: L-lactate permease [Clostridiales bacterium]|jgi:lactate permease|nr:L-lactate permease [Clostridiales bacterium]
MLSGSDILNAALAVLPIFIMLAALLLLKIPLHLASAFAFIACLVLAPWNWGMTPDNLADALAEGIFLAFCPVIWVIFSALFTYNLSIKNGGMNILRGMLSAVSDDKSMQALLIAFAFGGFLEAVAGFGTAVAIPAGILAALGFEPLFAAILCLVSNTVPVAFGVVGVPIITLSNVSEMPLADLSLAASLQLLPLAAALPCILVFMVGGGAKKVKEALVPALLSGLAFGLIQMAAAVFLAVELAAVTGSLAAFLTLYSYCRMQPKKPVAARDAITSRQAFMSLGSYIIILALVLATSLIPQISFLKEGRFVFRHQFYIAEGGSQQSFALLTNPGTLFFIAGLAGASLYKMSLREILDALRGTTKQISHSAFAIILILCIARIMFHAGMVSYIAELLAASGPLFPAISPLLGALGTFITGSDTSSNVLFGALQRQTALQTGANAAWIVAANASGATIGKMLSLQSISIACASIHLKGAESRLLKRTAKIALIMALSLSVIVFAGNLIYPA